MNDIDNYKITKYKFRNIVFSKTKHIATKYHIYNVINILLDELSKDLYEKNSEIKIKNFCTIKIVKNDPKRYWSVIEQKVKISPGNKKVKFNLAQSIKKIIYYNVNIDSL